MSVCKFSLSVVELYTFSVLLQIIFVSDYCLDYSNKLEKPEGRKRKASETTPPESGRKTKRMSTDFSVESTAVNPSDDQRFGIYLFKNCSLEE